MINKPLAISIALLISIASAHGKSGYTPAVELKPAIKKRGKMERLYDWAKAKKEAHPKIYGTGLFVIHLGTGALQLGSAIVGLKR